MKLVRSLLSTVVAVAVALGQSGDASAIKAADSAARLSPLTVNQRAAIDTQAVETTPAQSAVEDQLEFYGDVTGWLISRMSLPVEVEAQDAAEAHAAVVAESPAVATPDLSAAVFKKLVDALPKRMQPDAYRYTLYVLDTPSITTRTVGAGYVYVGADYLHRLAGNDAGSEDRLAFAFARELGHICRGDCRRGYQLVRLERELDDQVASHIDRRALQALVAKSVRVSGKVITFLYSEEQELKSDLFALHLCRNAGFNVESALDVLRLQVLAERDVGGVRDNTKTGPPHGRPSALKRLQCLRNELDGRVTGDEYGLFEFDRKTGKFHKLDGRCIDAGGRAIVFVHGIDSHFDIYDRAIEHMAALEAAKDVKLLCFHYPNDDSLARSGRFLFNEMSRVCESADSVDFICHSAGGLVFRYYAEVAGGAFRRAVLQGTPHAGSDMAKLRMLLETKQLIGGLPLGFPTALENALRDGKGQISDDLRPDSLFLRYLNARKSTAVRERYYIFRGHAIRSRGALTALESLLAVARAGLGRKLTQTGQPSLLIQSAQSLIDTLTLPDEVTNGDLAVTLESAGLEGATYTATYHAHHIALVKDRVIIEAISRIVLDGKPAEVKAGR